MQYSEGKIEDPGEVSDPGDGGENGSGDGSSGGGYTGYAGAIGNGETSNGKYAGETNWDPEYLSEAADLAAVTFFIPDDVDSLVEEVVGTSTQKQLRVTGKTLVDVATNGTTLTIGYYDNGQIGAPNGTTGIYALTGTPFSSLTITKIAGNKVTYVVRKSGTITGDWTLGPEASATSILDNLSHIQVLKDSWIDSSGMRNESYEERYINGAVNQLKRKTIDIYKEYSYDRDGDPLTANTTEEKLWKSIDDPDGAALTTKYEYASALSNRPEGGNYLRKIWAEYPDGSWAWFDGNTTWKPFKDATRPLSLPTNGAGLVKESGGETYIDNVLVSKSLSGSDVGSLFGVGNLSIKISSQYVSPTATLDTLSYYYPSEAPEEEPSEEDPPFDEEEVPTLEPTWVNANRLFATVYPDKTCDVYEYTKGTFTSPDGFEADEEGTCLRTRVTRCAVDGSGNKVIVPYKSTVSETVEDEAGKSLETSDWVYTTTSATSVLTTTRYEYDTAGNLLNTTRQKDGSGSWVTTYSATYDAAGNQLTETDEFGVVTTTTETGATTTTSSNDGIVTQTSTTTSDAAGRVLSETSGGLTTTYQYSLASGGGRKVTAILPNGATSITEYFRDGRLKSVSGTGEVHKTYDYTAASNQITTRETTGLREVKRVSDMAGRTVSTQRKRTDGVNWTTENYTYNALGQLTGITTDDGSVQAPRRFAYDVMGNQQLSGYDMDSNGTLDTGSGSNDRVSYNDLTYTTAGGQLESSMKSGLYLPSGALQILQEVRTGLDGLKTTMLGPGDRTVIVTSAVDRTNKKVVVTTLDSDIGKASRQLYKGNRTLTHSQEPWQWNPSSDSPTIGATGATQTSYSYLQGRLFRIIDALSRQTLISYHSQGEFGAGQVYSTSLPGGATIWQTYNAMGLPEETSGTGTYWSKKSYNGFGELIGLSTQGVAGISTTTWNRNPYTGLVSSKVDALGRTTSYTYNSVGRPLTRTNARSITTTYTYNTAGDPSSITYSSGTSNVSGMSYDKAGRLVGVTDGAGTRAITYSDLGMRKNETWTGTGALSGYAITRSFTNQRMTGLTATGPSSFSYSNYPVYNSSDRSWSYSNSFFTQRLKQTPKAGMLQIETVDKSMSGGPAIDTTTAYDTIGRIVSTGDVVGSTLVNAAGTSIVPISYDTAGRRTSIRKEDGSTWSYGYNTKNEVTSGGKKFSGGTVFVPGHQFTYAYDEIGNRVASAQGGANDGVGLNPSVYTPNTLNQYTQVDGASRQWVTGEAATNAKVFVNGKAAWRNGTFFGAEIDLGNTSASNALALTVKAEMAPSGGNMVTKTQSGTILAPPASATLTYDNEGNLSSDGVWNYTWDGENRLVQMQTVSSLPAASQRWIRYSYDFEGRMVSKTILLKPSGSWTVYPDSVTTLLYDGWNIIAERRGTINRQYFWGVDLSGTFRGAGGIGGLLMMYDSVTSKTYVYTNDANGNVTGLIDAYAGTVAAKYEYGPFGELLRASGPMAMANPFRWSSKYSDNESGLVYYGYRFYNSANGRWLNRDPIGERGGVNLYSIIGNQTTNNIDFLGLTCIESIMVTLSSSENSVPLPPTPEGYNNATGHIFKGSFAVKFDDGSVKAYGVKSGGYRMSNSKVSSGDDASTPAGNWTVSTTRNTWGLKGFEINLTGIPRTGVLVHASTGYGTHGCLGLVPEDMNELACLMLDTKTNCRKSTVPIYIRYSLPADQLPKGELGNGNSSDQDLPPPPGWPEPDPGPTNSTEW